MKKYMILQVIVIPLFLLALFAPSFLQFAITPVQPTTVIRTTYTENIFVNGHVEEKSKKDVYVNLPIVPDKVYYQVGDMVKAGDILATVDAVATKNALLQMADFTNLIPEQYIDVLGSINIDEKLIEDYVPTEVVAPIGGVITSISLVEGAISTPNTSVVTITQAQDNRLKMSVSEEQADKVKPGDVVVFKANATDDEKYVGTVERVFPNATKTIVGTSQATVVNFYVELAEDYERLKPGYTVTGVIRKAEPEIVHVLPYEAVLQDENNKEYIYVINQSRVERIYVETGRELPAGIEILSPSLFGKAIVHNASAIKRNNSLVRITK